MREMKDRGIEWIGEIPADWNLKKLKHTFTISSGTTPKSDNLEYWDGDIPWVTPADYKTEDKYVYHGRKFLSEAGLNAANLQLLPVNSIIFSKRAPIGAVAITGAKLAINQGCISCVPAIECDIRYYYFILSIYTEQFNLLGSGTTFKEISSKDFGNFTVPAPSVSVQEKLADYLDRKCSQIDAIIARQQEVIEKLKAYKLSVITEAVTKGLNPNVPMKDSGMDWIGEIPEHWKVCRLKNVLQQIKNAVKVGPFGSQLKTNDYVDAGYWVYTQRTVLDKNFDSNDTFISYEKYRDMEGFKVEADDILITTRGTGTTGHIAKVPQKFFEGILHPCLMRIKLDESICKYDYLFYLFEYATFIRNQIDFASNTSSLPVLYSYTLNNIWITLPSVNEQLQIATALNEVAAKIDNIIIKRQQVIDSLINYKKSLIYEVVTGKKEV